MALEMLTSTAHVKKKAGTEHQKVPTMTLGKTGSFR